MENTDTRIAKYGEKMIEVKIRFWTDGIAKEGKIRPRHAWDSGVVTINTNESHGLNQKSPIPFNSILDLPSAIADLLVREGVSLHANAKLRKLISKDA